MTQFFSWIPAFAGMTGGLLWYSPDIVFGMQILVFNNDGMIEDYRFINDLVGNIADFLNHNQGEIYGH